VLNSLVERRLGICCKAWCLTRDTSSGSAGLPRYDIYFATVRVSQLTTNKQPSDFWLDVYDIPHVLETPTLVRSLASFTEHIVVSDNVQLQRNLRDSKTTSSLFLHVHAAASYFTTNKTLMDSPPPVLADLILDPYMLNIFPKSLLPTAGYIIALVVISWFASSAVLRVLCPQPIQKSHID
jgi:hypothetical protein